MRIRNLLGVLLASFTFAAAAAIPATDQITAVEFYHADLDHFFISTNPAEIADLDTGVHSGWTRTGYEFPAFKIGSAYPGTSPVCRFYAPVISTHFYSAKPSECEDVKTKFGDTWTFEAAEVFRAIVIDPYTGICPTDTTAVYRLWNDRADVNHRYSDQIAVYQYMVAKGYKPEGDGNPALPVAYCTPSGGSVVPAPSATAPNCTVTASTGTPALGTTLSLAAQCTNNPTSYMWTGCTSSTSTCTPTQTTAGSKSYTLYSSNAQGPGAPVTINVNWGGGGGGGGALPICTISASAAALAAGTPLTLSVNCSQSPSNYDWMECSYLTQQICNIMPVCTSTAKTCVVNKSQAGFARYAIAASNSAGTGPRAAVDVEWTGGSTGGGGGGGGGDPIPVCNVLTSNASPLINTTVVLSASCTGNPTSYSWIGITCSQVQCGASSSTPGQVTYGVTAGNAAGTSTAYVAVNWQGPTQSPTPSCTLSASNTQPLLAQTITITANCTNSPTSYAWTGCTSTTNVCTDSIPVGGVTGNKTYSLIASNASGPGNTASVVVNWTAPPTSPPSCSVSANNSTPIAGTNVTLTASCNGAPTSYVWTNCASQTSTCSATAANAGSVTYTVAGVNSFGPGAVAPVTVNWQAPGSGGSDFCGSFSNVVQTSLSWGDSSRHLTASIGGFYANGVIVIEFTVPSSPSSYATAGNTNMAEYGEPATTRHMTLSKSRCDFRGTDSSGNNGPFATSYGNQVGINWNVGVQPAALIPGQTYYVNVRNWDVNIGASCSSTTCNAGFLTNWPK